MQNESLQQEVSGLTECGVSGMGRRVSHRGHYLRAQVCGPYPGSFSQPPTHLFRFDDDTLGSVIDLGPVLLGSQNIDADALAWSSKYGLLAFQVTTAAAPTSLLLSIDSGTAVAAPIGSPLAGRNIRGAAFNASGDLWVADAAQDQLLKIDPASSNVITAIDRNVSGSTFDLIP
jgi:hypothetical protein